MKAWLRERYAVESAQDERKSFGSWCLDNVHVGRRLRLVWDGKDQWFVLQGGQQWA
jgi:hypothetical protein